MIGVLIAVAVVVLISVLVLFVIVSIQICLDISISMKSFKQRQDNALNKHCQSCIHIDNYTEQQSQDLNRSPISVNDKDNSSIINEDVCSLNTDSLIETGCEIRLDLDNYQYDPIKLGDDSLDDSLIILNDVSKQIFIETTLSSNIEEQVCDQIQVISETPPPPVFNTESGVIIINNDPVVRLEVNQGDVTSLSQIFSIN